MAMKSMYTCTCLVWLASILVLVTAIRRKREDYQALSWSDCGGPDKIFHVSSLHISPMPVIVPGTMYVSFQANSTETITEAAMYLSVKTETFFGYWQIPCISNIGSCNYNDMCTVLDTMTSENWMGIAAEVATQIRGLLTSAGVSYQCPVQPSAMSVLHYPFQMPQLPALLAAFADGNYKVQFEIVKPSTGRQLGCFSIDMSMRRPSDSGWFFGRR